MQFFTKQRKQIDIQVILSGTTLPDTLRIRFLDLTIDNKLTWKPYGIQLANKLNKACYAIREVKSLISLKSLICIYHSYFHSLLQYGILFWGNSPTSGDVFKIQKRTIRIITNRTIRIITNRTIRIITNRTIRIITNRTARIITNRTIRIITNKG